MDTQVSIAFERALSLLAPSGACVQEIALSELLELSQLNNKGGLAPPEAYALLREWITQHAHAYDPRVRSSHSSRPRSKTPRATLNCNERAWASSRVSAAVAQFDALLMPTTPSVALRLAKLVDDAAYSRMNLLALRNPSISNSSTAARSHLPCHDLGRLPVGLTIAGLHGADRQRLSIAAAIEKILPVSPRTC